MQYLEVPSLCEKYLQFLFSVFNTFIKILVFKAVFSLLFLESHRCLIITTNKTCS